VLDERLDSGCDLLHVLVVLLGVAVVGVGAGEQGERVDGGLAVLGHDLLALGRDVHDAVLVELEHEAVDGGKVNLAVLAEQHHLHAEVGVDAVRLCGLRSGVRTDDLERDVGVIGEGDDEIVGHDDT